MQETMLALMGDYGYEGIAFLIWLENVFPPIPSEVVLLFGGFLTTRTALTPWGVILFATIGSTLGAAVLYGLGRIIGKEKIKRLFAGRMGKILHLSPDDADKADIWFAKYESKAVFFCRCLPIVRSLISIPAGIAGMRALPFFALTIAGSAVWNTVLVWLGRFAGAAWEQTLQYLGWYSKAALAVMVIAAVAAVWLRLKKRKAQQSEDSEEIET